MVTLVLVLLPVIGYLLFVASGFIHEAGHSVAGDWVSIEVTGFSPTKCFRLDCRIYPLEPLVGFRKYVVLFAGGMSASLWWSGIYLVTSRWHRTGGWLIGGVTAAFVAGEIVTAAFEGGWNWLYSNYGLGVLPVIFLAMVTGFVAQLNFAGQGFRICRMTRWLKPSQWSLEKH